MITKILKERKHKAEQFDKIIEEIKRRFDTCDKALDEYMNMSKNDICYILNIRHIQDLDAEWHVYKSLLERFEGS